MNSDNLSKLQFKAIIIEDPSATNIIFPKWVMCCSYPVGFSTDGENNIVNIRDDDFYIIDYQDQQSERTVYIPYKLARKLNKHISADETYMPVYLITDELNLSNVIVEHPSWMYSIANNYKVVETYENMSVKQEDSNTIVLPLDWAHEAPHMIFVGRFNANEDGYIYPLFDYQIIVSTISEVKLPQSLSKKLGVRDSSQIVFFFTDREKDETVTNNESIAHFQIPTHSVIKSLGNEPEIVLEIPIQYMMTIRPIFNLLVDGLKKDMEETIMEQFCIDTFMDSDSVLSEAIITKLDLKREYFEELIYRVISSYNNLGKQVTFQMSSIATGRVSDTLNIIGNDLWNMYDYLEEGIIDWVNSNNIEVVLNLPEYNLTVDKLHINKGPLAVLEVYNMEEEVTNSIISDLDLINIDITKTEGDKGEQSKEENASSTTTMVDSR